MASVRTKAYERFPAGATVGAYLARDRREGAAPAGGAVVSGTMSADGVSGLLLSGLALDEEYVLYALVGGQHRYVKVLVESTAAAEGRPLHVRALGTVKQDGKVVGDAAMTAGLPGVVSDEADFTAADVGKIVAVIGAGAAGGTLGARIASVESPTNATLDTVAGTTVADTALSYGTDDALALQAMADMLEFAGGALAVDGLSMLGSRVVVPAGVQVVGSGLDYANFGAGAGGLIGGAPARGGVWKAGGAFNAATSLVRFGENKVTYASGEVSPSAQWMVFDGSYLAESGAQTWAARGFFAQCWFGQGLTHGLDMSGQNSRCFGCVVENGGIGNALYLNANDVKFFQGEVRNGGTAQIRITGACGNFWIAGNDVFGGGSAGAPISHGILIDPTTQGNTPITCQGMIVGNSIDATRGEMLKIAPAAGIRVGSISFSNNRSYGVGSWPNSTFGVIRIDLTAAGSELRGFQANNNNIDVGSGSGNWAFFAALTSGTGTVDNWIFTGNVVRKTNQLFASFVPSYQDGNTWRKTDSGVERNSVRRGIATFSGDGLATTFNIVHAMSDGSAAPTSVNITPASAAARDGWHVGTIDATNIPIVFGAAPAAGSNNLVFHWEARL